MFKPTPLRIFLPFLVALTVLAVNSCGDAGNAEGWESKPSQHSLPAIFREVPVDQVAVVCGQYHGKTTHGCAWRNWSEGLCYVYHGPGVKPWLLQHEALHCAGFEHA